jgi:hypothetical protein
MTLCGEAPSLLHRRQECTTSRLDNDSYNSIENLEGSKGSAGWSGPRHGRPEIRSLARVEIADRAGLVETGAYLALDFP